MNKISLVLTLMLFLGLFCLSVTEQTFASEDIGELKTMAEQGNAQAQHDLGLAYIYTDDEIEAVKWYHKAAEQGHIEAQYSLGMLYFSGRGVEENYTEGAKWVQKAAEQGDMSAQYFLGSMYHTGQYGARDETRAKKWLQKAADQGSSDAKSMLFSY